MTARRAIKIVLFVIFALAIAGSLTVLFLPYHSGTYTKETVQGMYHQPDNTAQVAFFGTSAPLSAFSPVKLYEEYGIGGYNCSTSVQPVIMSYYLLKDLLRHQDGSLKLAVIDPSVLIDTTEAEKRSAWAERVLFSMEPSLVKLEATGALVDTYPVEPIEQYIPILKYHSRWNALTEADFDLQKSVSDTAFSRGQYIRYSANVENDENAEETTSNNLGITEEIDHDLAELENRWDPDNKQYLDEFMKLCDEQGIQVIFTKVPRKDWDDSMHDSMKHLADSYGVSYLDFNMPEVFDKCELSYATDFVDNKHPNIHGSQKITHYLGEYLKDAYDFEELDANKKAAMDADVEKYKQCEEDGELLYCTDLVDYLDLLKRDRYTVFIAVRGDASAGLTDEARAKLNELGLKNLATIGQDEAYLAIMNGGKLVTGRHAENPEQPVKLSGQYKDGNIVTGAEFQKGASIKPLFKVESGGTNSGDYGLIRVDGDDLSENGEGINFVVFNRDSGELLDTACFDTHVGTERTSDRSA